MEIFTNKINSDKEGNAVISMSGAENVSIGPPELYGGSKDTLNPEEMFAAAVNSCIMLVFQHFARKKHINLISYKANADAKVEKTKNGLRFTEVTVNAEVEVEQHNKDKVKKAAELAEKYCLVSNSVNCPVDYKIEIVN
jgi:organic hydroperoxide reductase OsmC/OhrA